MPTYDFRAPRLFVDDPLAAGASTVASPAQANYLANVLRLSEGAGVILFNGRDGEWRATIAKPSKKRVEFRIVERLRGQTRAAGLVYLFAPLKHARLDYMVQKATEMGAGTLQPVITQHTQGSRFNIERARANAVEAAEQCGILSVPECREAMRLTDLLAAWEPGRHLVFCDESEDAASPIDTLARLRGRDLALLIGPEGGFSNEEREMLRACDFVTAISLGPRILRADTAAVAALALVQAAAGDWRVA